VKALSALRGSVVAAVVVGVLAVSGCATAQTAAVVNGHRITEQDLQEATSQINATYPDSTLTTANALSSLVMASFINQVADEAGKGMSDSAARAAVSQIAEPTATTLELVKSSVAAQQLTSVEQGKVVELATKAAVTINPRYGTFDAAKVRFDVSKPNWIKAEPEAPAPAPQG
jgi:creatinine amidohydrolase/Fe(II)-dependent formamide hydrolase-like protein